MRAGGFMRIAYRDEVDGTPQYARAYLPAGYDPAKKWPLVLQLHGYNPANPPYVRWWSSDSRHPNIDTEFAGDQQVIYIEPHGRGNTQYMRRSATTTSCACIAEAKKLLQRRREPRLSHGRVDGRLGHVERRDAPSRIVRRDRAGVRRRRLPLADVRGAARGADAGRALPPGTRQQLGAAEGLNNMPIYIHHGDADAAVNVEWSRWGVKHAAALGLRRALSASTRARRTRRCDLEQLESEREHSWFLKHARDPKPRHVRIRSRGAAPCEGVLGARASRRASRWSSCTSTRRSWIAT